MAAASYRRRQDTGAWELYLGRGPDGKRIRLSLPASTPEREVRAHCRRADRERIQDRPFPAAESPITVAEWAGEYVAWHELEFPASHFRVRQVIEQHILPAFGGTRLAELDAKAVERWRNNRRGEVKAHTVAKELRVFKALVNRAVREGHITASPIEHVEAPRIVDARAPLFYTADEMRRLYEACVEPWHAPAWRLLANTGMRRGEALHARREWIQGHLLNIRSTGEERTKSGEWRSIPISDGAREALEQLATLNAGSPYILPRITPPSFFRAAAKCIGRAGLAGSLHTLRHTYGSLLVMQGVPIRVVQQYMGHAHVATTEIYLHLAPGFAAEAALRLAV